MLHLRSIASSSAGNLHILSDGDTAVMLDCGIPWRKAREAVGFNVAGDMPILVTHEHKDHCKGVLDAQCRNDIYLPIEAQITLGLRGYNHHGIIPGKTHQLGTLRFVAFPLAHDVPCLGYLIAGTDGEKAAYITDTGFVPNRLPALSLLAVECNFCEERLDYAVAKGVIHRKQADRIAMTHFGLGSLLKFLKANDLRSLREIHLLHLSDGNSDEMFMRVAVEDVVSPETKVFVAPKN